MKIAVCDDNELFIKQICDLINLYMSERQLHIEIHCFNSGVAFLRDPCTSWDVVFLDINMDGLDGISTARKLRERNDKVLIVFITSFIEYSLQGYEVAAVRYLIKDQLEQHFTSCMDFLIDKISARQDEITLKFIEGVRSIPFESVTYIESNNHRLDFNIESHEGNKSQFHIYDKLDKYEPCFVPYGFLRIHKSYIVNMRYISYIKAYSAFLQTGEELPIPKAKFTEIKTRYVLYKGAR